MEERVSPSSSPQPPLENTNKNHSTKLQLLETNPGTYIVQVPKEQVYRVPPPENTYIAEQHRKSPPKAAKTSGLLSGIFSMLLSPKDPKFSIQRFKVVESKPHPKYNVTLSVHNSNSKVGISYKDKSHVSLSLRKHEIASGAYPTFFQDPHDTRALGIVLKGSKARLPKEVEESITNNKKKVHLTFSLAIQILAQMKIGLLHSGKMDFDVMCKMNLDTLAKNSRVLSQQCETKRH
ncbi:NDR1/HIN1-like protein 13, partial [Mucuna pruriens]